MNEQSNEGSGTNTILIVILLLTVVAGGVWFVTRGNLGGANDDTRDINVDLSIPSGQQGQGERQ